MAIFLVLEKAWNKETVPMERKSISQDRAD